MTGYDGAMAGITECRSVVGEVYNPISYTESRISIARKRKEEKVKGRREEGREGEGTGGREKKRREI